VKLMVYIILFFFDYLRAYDDHFLFNDNFYKQSLEPQLDSLLNEKYDNYNDLRLNGILHKTQNFNYSIFSLDFDKKFEKISISLMPIIISENINEISFGSKYSRNSIYSRLEKSFLIADFGSSEIKLGRGYQKKTLYPHHSIIDSGLSPSRDEISFRTKFRKTDFEFSFGKLDNEKDSLGTLISRNFANHKLIWKISNNFTLEAGEIVIYTGLNRNFDFTYANPFIPYFLNGIESERKNLVNDNDNSIIFFSVKKDFKNINTYIELIIDDFQIDKTGRENSLGYKVGFHNIQNNSFAWLFEYVEINKWTYLHHGNKTSWENRGIPIGFSYGPESKYLSAKVVYKTNNLIVNSQFNFLRKGNNNFTSLWLNGIESTNEEYLDYFFSSISLIKKFKRFNYEIGWSNIPFNKAVSHNSGKVLIDGRFFVNAFVYFDFLKKM
jgi:hypothetical protein